MTDGKVNSKQQDPSSKQAPNPKSRETSRRATIAACCNGSVKIGRARLSPGRRSRNQSGARTFLSAALSNGSKALGRSDPVGYSGVAADKNVRAPVASQKSSRFAQTFAHSNPARPTFNRAGEFGSTP